MENYTISGKYRKSKTTKNGGSTLTSELTKKVGAIYQWIDRQVKANAASLGQCSACGKCCNFEKFGHRLFVTSCELMYFEEKVGTDNISPFISGRCPCNINGRCSVYPWRFAGCRIFCCKADGALQSELSEAALKKFKLLCEEMNIDYRYTDLPAAFKNLPA